MAYRSYARMLHREVDSFVDFVKTPTRDPLVPLPKVPPRRVDVMHGPVYVPERITSSRRGSEDFKKYSSHGNQC